ncbi:MAG TPA: nucleotide exchange factor GrpE [Gemmatimonadales bacterium]
MTRKRHEVEPPEEASVDDETDGPGELAAPSLDEDPREVVAAGIDPVAAELEDLRDRHIRLAADFDNFRKRTAKERQDGRLRAQGELLTGLLDALDDLARVAHLDSEQSSVPDVVAGVELVERNLLRKLQFAGLEPIGTDGERFDPNVHEAVGMLPAPSADVDHTVATVLQAGYRFHGQLLRPARVMVHIWTEPDLESTEA